MIENFNSVQEFLEVIIMEEDDKKVAKKLHGSASLVNFDSIMMQNKLITSTRAG